jgi:asparagine synthase (glutamine-hydrolysing)
MCGIAGIFKFARDARVDEATLRRMCATMLHRGPDDEGILVRAQVGLAMRRLSIIDLAGGHQPLCNEDGTTWIIFNGEIYNHVALRQRLIKKGHRFSSRSDTETILHLYEELGSQCVAELRGMFAFAIWDSRTGRLFLARDRLGIKPLYYGVTPEALFFGSEIKVLLALPEFAREFDRTALPEYLAFGYLSGSQTFYKSIHKLMPGHWLEIDAEGQLRVEKYWDLTVSSAATAYDEQYCVKTYRDLLEKAVASHLMSDVPLGVFLSGGLDSSTVAALMSRIRGGPIETFSVGYPEETSSELSHARVVAEHLHSNHHEVLLREQEFFEALPKLIWHEDEPITWPSSIALYFVAQLARKHVTVVLTGEGSDETLAGYTRYAFTLKNAAWDRVYRGIIPDFMRREIRQSISDSGWLAADIRRKLQHTFLARNGNSWPEFYFDNFFAAFSEAEQANLFHPLTQREFSEGQSYRNVFDYWEHAPGDMLQRLLYTDIKTYLVELLMKQDNMSMAASIESRVPFLDHELVEFAIGIPQKFLISGLAGKEVLKKAVQDLLPHSIVRRTKLGFPTPWSRWMMGTRLESIEKFLLEDRSLGRELFEPAAIQRIFREHRQRRRDHCDRIWRLLNLELWQRVCLEGDFSGLATEAAIPTM